MAMGAPSKRARRVRSAGEFDRAKLLAQLAPPNVSPAVYAWALSDILGARDDQMRGQFKRPAQMAAHTRTDDAISVAFETRLAPLRCIEVALVSAKGARGTAVANEAEGLFGSKGVGITPDTIADVQASLVDHGLAVGLNSHSVRADGSRVDMSMQAWPMEFVRWDPMLRSLVTQVDGGPVEPIVHGDGRWVVFRRNELEPFKHGALVATSLVWARHAFALRDWAKASVAHGNAKVIGELPAQIPLQKDGTLSADATKFLELLRAIASADSPVGIRPAGSKTDFLANGSTAWQVWKELVLNAEKAAARIYLGTDGVLGAGGGAPGVDIGALFGVATTKVQGDIACIERAILTGVIEPWCALNFGDSTLAPTRKYLLPDADEDARHKAHAERKSAFYADIAAARANGFEVTQAFVDELAEQYDVEPPQLPAETDSKAPTITLAPTDIARVVSVNEARASAGLPKLLRPDGSEDPDGRLTVEEYSAKKAANAAAAAAPPAAPPAA